MSKRCARQEIFSSANSAATTEAEFRPILRKANTCLTCLEMIPFLAGFDICYHTDMCDSTARICKTNRNGRNWLWRRTTLGLWAVGKVPHQLVQGQIWSQLGTEQKILEFQKKRLPHAGRTPIPRRTDDLGIPIFA